MLQSWLSPAKGTFADPDQYQKYQIGCQVTHYLEGVTQLKKDQIALIGVEAAGADLVRQALYRLTAFGPEGRIIDLGNLRKQSEDFLAPVVRELLDSQIMPVLIGGNGESLTGQVYAHRQSQKAVSAVMVDEVVRYAPNAVGTEPPLLHKFIQSGRSDFFQMVILAYQRHLVDPAAVRELALRNFELISLGQVHRDVLAMEPYIRDADFMGFHLAALKWSEAPGQVNPSPNGLYTEEACQLCRYAGMSDKMRSLGVYGFEAGKETPDSPTIQLVAQMIWYFLEGVYNRQNDYPVTVEGMKEYIVHFRDHSYDLRFWRSERSGRWWIEVPVRVKETLYRHRLIPCSYGDYQKASKNELPDRFVRAFQRYE